MKANPSVLSVVKNLIQRSAMVAILFGTVDQLVKGRIGKTTKTYAKRQNLSIQLANMIQSRALQHSLE